MNTSKISLTFTQCKQIAENADLRDVVERLNDQPEFMSETHMIIESIAELQSIIQCGCASTAHRSVYYYDALRVMVEYGDDVLEYLEQMHGQLPEVPTGESWSAMASFYLSAAVEAWCNQFEYELSGVNWD